MFTKYDVYTTVQSMYCYPDTDVLINKLNIHDKAELKQAEEEFTAVKQMALLQEPIKGRFTKTHLFRIHHFLFEDVYPFAGHIRKEQISKGDTMFYPPDLIDRELERVFKNIHSKKLLAEQDEEKQIQNLSQTMAELFYLEKFDSIDQLEKAIIDYIDYYNNRRIKLKLNGLSPVQYRIQTVGAA